MSQLAVEGLQAAFVGGVATPSCRMSERALRIGASGLRRSGDQGRQELRPCGGRAADSWSFQELQPGFSARWVRGQMPASARPAAARAVSHS
ncbi:hypothetical protein AB595_20740 [Massilia sp. WF1]|nr:hypothetical protein AB595_20740 [Massilia sp. WF1]